MPDDVTGGVPGAPRSLAGRTIGVTADRRWQQQADLFSRRGATVLHGPTMRTVDLAGDERLRTVTEDLCAHPPDVLVATTGAGLRLWLEAAEGWGRRDRLQQALAQAKLVARGAKAASAAKGAGLHVWWQAPSEAMPEVVAHLRAHLRAHDGTQARVAVQLFDPDDHPTTRALRQVAADLVEVPVYRWLLPVDLAPAQALVRAVADGRVAAVTFTSQPAVHNLFRIAAGLDLVGPLRAALNGPVLPACIGAVCAEAARDQGVERPVWPEPPRLPALVRLVDDQLS